MNSKIIMAIRPDNPFAIPLNVVICATELYVIDLPIYLEWNFAIYCIYNIILLLAVYGLLIDIMDNHVNYLNNGYKINSNIKEINPICFIILFIGRLVVLFTLFYYHWAFSGIVYLVIFVNGLFLSGTSLFIMRPAIRIRNLTNMPHSSDAGIDSHQN